MILQALDTGGDGAAIVLLHPGVGDHRLWEPLLPFLEGRRVVAPDLRGFGASRGPLTGFRHADDVLETIDALGLGEVVLVGGSFGGRVAIDCAALRPDGFARLVLLSAAAKSDLEPSGELRAFAEREGELLEAGDLEGTAALNAETWTWRPEARDLVARLQRELFERQLAEDEPDEDAFEPGLAGIRAPAVVAVGEHDLPDFHADARLLADAIPGARHEVVPGCGHLVAVEDPEAAAALITG